MSDKEFFPRIQVSHGPLVCLWLFKDLPQKSSGVTEFESLVQPQTLFRFYFHLSRWAKSNDQLWFNRAISELSELIDVSLQEAVEWFSPNWSRQIFVFRSEGGNPLCWKICLAGICFVCPWPTLSHKPLMLTHKYNMVYIQVVIIWHLVGYVWML